MNKGFTLIDTIVAIGVMTVVIIGVTGLTFMSIRANQFNQNRLQAYYLALEGLEAVRNMRDSNWLQNYQWNGLSVDDGTVNFGSLVGEAYIFREGEMSIPDQSTRHNVIPRAYGSSIPRSDGIYVIERNFAFSGVSNPPSYAPWQWWYFKNIEEYKAQLSNGAYIGSLEASRCELSQNNSIVCNSAEKSPYFKRYFEISYLSNYTVMHVESVVTYSERGRDKELRLATELTDWRRGPL